MTTDEVTVIVQALPTARSIGDDAYWQQTVPAMLNAILDEIASAYDWDFVMAEYGTEVTVASQADYDIRGAKNELRDIMSIRLGSAKTVLAKLRTLDADNARSGGGTFGGVKAWYSATLTNDGFPVVTLIDTPSVAGTALWIRYRTKTPQIHNFPDSFANVITLGVMAWVSDGIALSGQNMMNSRHQGQFNAGHRYQQALKNMIARYRTGGSDIDLAGVDPHITLANKRRSDLYGVG